MAALDTFRATTDAPVVLFYPRIQDPQCGTGRGVFDQTYRSRAPLPLLALAGPLEQAGYRVTIIDAITAQALDQELLRSVEGALCLGISCMAGYQVYEALQIARLVRARYPSLPLVWGGWFPTMSAETIEDPHVDIVVRGQGEVTFLELVQRLSQGLPIGDVRGIAYKENGRVISTPQRPVIHLDQNPPLPYHLIDVDSYLAAGRGARRSINYYTSYGCPYRCTFCSNDEVFGPRWYPLSPQRVVDELERLVSGCGATEITLDDANFFVSKERTRQICELIAARGLAGAFEWGATGTANVIAKFDADFLRLLRRCGCSKIFIGAETGSQELMEVFKKPVTSEQVLRVAQVLGEHDILPWISFVLGVPGEPEDALEKTLSLAAGVYRANPRAKVGLHYFTPIPDVPLTRSPAVQAAFHAPPQTLEQWGQEMRTFARPRLETSPSYCRKVDRFRCLADLAHEVQEVATSSPLARALRSVALLRLRSLWLELPVVEGRIYRYIA